MVNTCCAVDVASNRRSWLRWLMGGAMAAGAGTWLLVPGKREEPVVGVIAEPTSATEAPPKPRANLKYCFAAADEFYQKDRVAMRAALGPIDEFFGRIPNYVEPMVDDLFSLSSSFWLVKYLAEDQIRGTNWVEEFIAEKIETWIELPTGLRQAMARAEAVFQRRMVANEERLYVQIEPELKLLVPAMSLAEYRRLVGAELAAGLKKPVLQAGKLGAAANLTSTGLDMLVGYLFSQMIQRAVQTAVARVVTSLAARGGAGAAEAAALGTGAAGSPWTGGLSLLVSVLVAVLIDWIIGKISASYAVADLRSAVKELHQEVRNSLWSQLSALVKQLHASRRQMIEKAFAAGG